MATIERQDTILTVTPTAASKVLELMQEDPTEDVAVLRVAIQGGGCSGFQYGLGFDRGAAEGDLEVEQHGVRVVVDPFSAPYLQGAVVDFVNGLQESGFKIENPDAVGPGPARRRARSSEAEGGLARLREDRGPSGLPLLR